MKKFSDVSNQKIEKIKSKKEVISGLVEESLSIKDGVIVGKELLVETINKIIEMNDSKTTINVLESVRLMSYRGSLDFNVINESIENETKKLNSIKHEPIVETVEVVEEVVVNESNFSGKEIGPELEKLGKQFNFEVIMTPMNVDKIQNILSKNPVTYPNNKKGIIAVNSLDVVMNVYIASSDKSLVQSVSDEIAKNTKASSSGILEVNSNFYTSIEVQKKINESLEIVNESVLTPDMIAGLIGITSIVGLGQLLIALDGGKLGEVGKKFAKQLRELNDVASSVKTGTLDAETYDKIYKESVSNEEDLDLKPLISEIQELNSDEYKEVLNSIEEGEFGEGTKKLIDVLSNLNEITRKKLSENK